MGRRGVSGNRSPNAGFLLVRSESGSSTKVSPKFHCAQARCFATALLGTKDFQGKPANPANSTPSDVLETCLRTTTAPSPPQPGTDHDLSSKASAEHGTVPGNAKKFAIIMQKRGGRDQMQKMCELERPTHVPPPYRTLPSNKVIDFIRRIKRRISRQGTCVAVFCVEGSCRKRWIVILCNGCNHKLVGEGGGRPLV